MSMGLHTSRSTVVAGVRQTALLALGGTQAAVTELVDAQAQPRGIDVPVAPDEGGGETRFGQDVENAVEDALAVGRNDVAAFTQAPGDGIQRPDDEREHAAGHEDAVYVFAKCESMSPRHEPQLVEDVQHRGAAERVEPPLVPATDQRAQKSSHNHDFVESNHPQDRWPRHPRGEEQVGQEQRCGDNPASECQLLDLKYRN